MAILDAVKNARLAGNGLLPFASNSPNQYAGKQKQYFSDETKLFVENIAWLSNDYVLAEAQGIDPENPYGWQRRFIRMADFVSPKISATRRTDDHKVILFKDKEIQYIVPGSKIKAMGSVWLVTNPQNISGSDGAAVVDRCNTVWNHLDWYGNVVSEPMVISNERADADDSDYQERLLITKGYFNATMQYNPDTAQISTNTRMILGDGCFRVTGLPQNFLQEFTGDYSSVRMISFRLRYEEPNREIDDMERHVADGLQFKWTISVNGPEKMAIGDRSAFAASSTRMGAAVDQSKASYLWYSSDETVAVVDERGNVTAVSEGEAEITATLSQNQTISGAISVTVAAPEELQSGVAFVSQIPERIPLYQSVTIKAGFFSGGEQTEDIVDWSFTGADRSSYSVKTDGNAATVSCWGYSSAPLAITASCNGQIASEQVQIG